MRCQARETELRRGYDEKLAEAQARFLSPLAAQCTVQVRTRQSHLASRTRDFTNDAARGLMEELDRVKQDLFRSDAERQLLVRCSGEGRTTV